MRRIHAPPQQRWRSMALLSGGLFLLGAGVSVAAALDSDLGGDHGGAYLALALAFAVVGGCLIGVRRAVSMRMLYLLGLFGIVGLSVGVALGDPVWSTYVPFYAWMAAVFALTATDRGLVLMLAGIVAGFSSAVAFHPAVTDIAAGASWMFVIIGLTVFIRAARATIGRSLRQERDLEVERYHSLLETLPGVVYRCRIDREWTLELLGPGVVELTGYTSEALLAKKPAFSSLMNADDSAAAWGVMEDALAAGESFHTRYRLTRRDGSEIWIEDWSRPTHGRDGPMLEGILFDVTREVNERAQADAVREEYRTLVETIPLVTYVDGLKPDLPALYLSPQLQTILGYTDEEWRDESTRWANLLHPEDCERAVSENRLHIETGRPFRMEYRLRARDGSWRWFLDESVIMRDQAGAAISSRGYMVDVTQQKELEHQLAYAAFHDSLTDLANRALFRDRIEHALSRGSRVRWP